MQSAAGKSVVVGEGGTAVDLGDSSYNMFILKSPRQAQSDLKVGVNEYGGADGATIDGGHRAPIREVFNCLIHADMDAADPEVNLIQRMRDTLGIFNRSPLQWYAFDIDQRGGVLEDVRGEAIINGPIEKVSKGIYVYEFQLPLLFPSGRKFSAEVNNLQAGVDTVGFTFDVDAANGISGNIDSDQVLLEITNTHSAAFTSVRVRVDATSTDITTLASLAVGQTMVIDSRTQHISKLSDSSSMMAGVLGSGTFPMLKPGITNNMTIDIVTTSAASNMYDIDLKWRGAFVL